VSDEFPANDALIDVDDILDDAPVAPPRDRPPGPGLPESLGWVIGVFIFQLGAGLVALFIGIALMIAVQGRQPQNPQEAIEGLIDGLPPTGKLLFFAVPNALAFAFLIGFGLLRMWPAPLRKLNFSRPSLTQTVVLCSAVLPLGLIADALFQPVELGFQWLVKEFPQLSFFNELNVIEFMQDMQGASLLALLLCVAVVPAIGEEFVFRGLIGRGLVARWGVVAGVLMTSMLFAGMHMYPPHVAAVFPLGVVMHIAYLTTRSFWAPMMVHFINNGIASLYTAIGAADAETMATPLWMTILAPFYVVLCCVLLWRHRTRYVDEDGISVWPGYRWFTPEHASGPDAPRREVRESMPVLIIFGLLFAIQVGLVGVDVATAFMGQAGG